MQQITSSQASPEIIINENFSTLNHVATYGKDPVNTTGLIFAFYGGRYNENTVTDGSVTLTSSSTNYLVINKTTGVLTSSTSTTNWNDYYNYFRAYIIVTGSSSISAITDCRMDKNGVYSGELAGLVTQNPQINSYTLTLNDIGKHIFHSTAAGSGDTYTIPANSSVAFPIGSTIMFVNQNGSGSITIAITSDTLRLAGAGTTGSRTLAANGVATILKITSTEWIIYGTGLT